MELSRADRKRHIGKGNAERCEHMVVHGGRQRMRQADFREAPQAVSRLVMICGFILLSRRPLEKRLYLVPSRVFRLVQRGIRLLDHGDGGHDLGPVRGDAERGGEALVGKLLFIDKPIVEDGAADVFGGLAARG